MFSKKKCGQTKKNIGTVTGNVPNTYSEKEESSLFKWIFRFLTCNINFQWYNCSWILSTKTLSYRIDGKSNTKKDTNTKHHTHQTANKLEKNGTVKGDHLTVKSNYKRISFL